MTSSIGRTRILPSPGPRSVLAAFAMASMIFRTVSSLTAFSI
nr:hypothetical protein [Candidatus Sigynarchaeum springense]